MKGMFLDLRNQGKAIILSTHQMNQVEELCDRVLMVNRGRAVLYGNLSDIKAKYRSNSVFVDIQGETDGLPGVVETRSHRGYRELVLDGTTTPQQVLAYLVNNGFVINRFEAATPTLHEIFLQEAGKKGA